MDGLAVVPPLLLVPPIAVRVPELSLDLRRVGVRAVLFKLRSANLDGPIISCMHACV